MDKPDLRKTSVVKKMFFVALFDLSWRMLGAMLLPIFAGLYLDKITGSDKKFALGGFVVGIIGSVLVIKSVVNKISRKNIDV